MRPPHVPANWIEGPAGVWNHPSRVRGGLGAGQSEPNQGRSLVEGAPAPKKGNACLAGSDDAWNSSGRSGGQSSKAILIVTFLVRKRKLMDEHDNLRASLKPLADAIAASVNLEDKDSRLTWQYEQVKTSGVPGVTVTLELIEPKPKHERDSQTGT